jgi:hypothetical protein
MIIKQFLRFAIIFFMISPFMVFADENIDSITIYEYEYQPGVGLFVGKVFDVSGKVVIIHLDETSGYHVTKDMKVYRGDTIVTGSGSKVVIGLNDGSQISQGEISKIQLNQLVYAPKRKTRNSFIRMSSGNARFSVQKLKSFKNRRFRVKTATALIGVRGSDFMIQVKQDLTEVAAFEDTELDLIGLDTPDLPPVRLRSYEKSSIAAGESPSSPISLSIEEMDGLKNEFLLNKQAINQTETKEKESEKKHTIRVSQTDTKKMSSNKELNIHSNALQPPLTFFSNEFKQFEDENWENKESVLQQRNEIATELPEFPQFP